MGRGRQDRPRLPLSAPLRRRVLLSLHFKRARCAVTELASLLQWSTLLLGLEHASPHVRLSIVLRFAGAVGAELGLRLWHVS